MRIAMIDNSRGWGGAEDVLLSLAKGLIDRGHKVAIFVREGAETVGALQMAGLDVRPISRQGIGMVGGMLRMIGMVRRDCFDLIHVHRNHDIPVGKIAAVAVRAPLLLTQHCLLGKSSSILMGLADRIVAVSRFIGADMEQRFPVLTGKVEVVHNGIDLSLFGHPEPGYWRNEPHFFDADPLVGVVGYFYKNQEELIDMLPKLKAEFPGMGLVVIGKDDARLSLLRDRAVERGVADSIFFVGAIPRHEMGHALAGLALNISAYRREGFGLSVVEGMAVGTPFVGYRSGGYTDIVEEGQTGHLVATNSDLCDTITRLLKDHTVRKAMSLTAQRRAAERFSLFRMLDRYELLMMELANR